MIVAAGLDVEGAGRLVGEDQPRAAHEGAGDRDALLLAAGELVGHGPQALAEPDALEHLDREPLAAPELAAGRVEQRGHDVLERRAPGQQVELLEDEADVAAAPAVALAGAEPLERDLVEEQPAAGRGVEQPEQVEQRRLAAAGAADDAHVIADLDLEVDAAQDLERAARPGSSTVRVTCSRRSRLTWPSPP